MMRKCDLPMHGTELDTTLRGYLEWHDNDPQHAFKGHDYQQKRVTIALPLIDTLVSVWRNMLRDDDVALHKALSQVVLKPANVVTLVLLLALPDDLSDQLIKLESDNMQLCYHYFNRCNTDDMSVIMERIDESLQRFSDYQFKEQHVDRQILLLLSAIVLQNSGRKDADGDYYNMDAILDDNEHKYDILRHAQQQLLHNLNEQRQRYDVKAHQATLRNTSKKD